MNALSPILRQAGAGILFFHCPGCDQTHQVAVGDGPGPRWGYNGNPDKPTFTPSLLIRMGHYVGGGQPGNCWCDYEERLGADSVDARRRDSRFSCGVCHSYIIDGRIQFLSDCTHALAGQTVDLPAFPAREP